MRSRLHMLLFAVLAVSAFGGCARNRVDMLTMPPFEGRSYGRYPGTGVSHQDRYRIGVGDIVRVHVRNHPEFEGKMQVDAVGTITMPLTLDEVAVVGLTRREAAETIAEALRQYVVADPRVWVQLDEPNSRFVYVLGAVRSPGKYAMQAERLYVREAVQRAGWPLRDAALNRTRLVSSKPERAAERRIRLGDVMYRGDLSYNYELEAGDIVYVPYTYVSTFVYHAMQVLRPVGVVFNYDDALYRASKIPRVSNEDDDDNDNEDD